MKASDIRNWPKTFSPNDWPDGVLDLMDSSVIVDGVFKLRYLSGVPMWPSSLFGAHIRLDGSSKSQHYAVDRLATATDMHVSTTERMIKCMYVAEQIPQIGGIGIYFDTNTPIIHIDTRPQRLVWIRDSNGEYIYRENDPVKFYKSLASELAKKGL